jgi:hypothetical protein
MNRRNFLAGGLLFAGSAPPWLRAFADLPAPPQNHPPSKAPQNLLTQTFPESFLASHLSSVRSWNPYPRYDARSAWQSVPSDVATLLIDRANRAMSQPWEVLTATEFLDFKRTGNRSRYESREFGRRAKLSDLVVGECLEGKRRFLDSIVDGVWLTCEESFWGAPAHLPGGQSGAGLPDVTNPTVELFGAETGSLLAWTDYLLGEQLDQVSPRITQRIRLEAQRHLLQPARDRVDFWWMGLDGTPTDLNNWNPWINSNLLVTNLLLEDDEKLRLQSTVKITKSLDAYLNQYSPDAGCGEGPGYWAVSAASYFECVHTLDSATGSSSKIFANPFLNQMGRYIANIHIAGNYYVDFGDAHPEVFPPGELIYRFGKAVKDEQFSAFGSYRAHRSGLAASGADLTRQLERGPGSLSRFLPALMDVAEVRDAPQEDALIRDAWYPDLGLMTAREKAGSADGMYLAVQAASNGRSHAHNDSGSFIVYHDGEPLVIDVGVGTYTAQTFSADRYSIWTMQSAYHNLPTVGGIMQHQGQAYQAKVIAYKVDDNAASVTLDLAGAYPKEAGVETWQRTFTLDRKRGTVLLKENFRLAHSVPVSLTIITPGAPLTPSAGTLVLRSIAGRGVPVSLTFDDSQIQPVVEKIPLTDPELREPWGNEIYRIRLNSRNAIAHGIWSFEFKK